MEILVFKLFTLFIEKYRKCMRKLLTHFKRIFHLKILSQAKPTLCAFHISAVKQQSEETKLKKAHSKEWFLAKYRIHRLPIWSIRRASFIVMSPWTMSLSWRPKTNFPNGSHESTQVLDDEVPTFIFMSDPSWSNIYPALRVCRLTLWKLDINLKAELICRATVSQFHNEIRFCVLYPPVSHNLFGSRSSSGKTTW